MTLLLTYTCGFSRRVTHASLGRQVDHALRLVRREGGLDRAAIGQVRVHVHVVGVAGKPFQPRLLEADVVVVVEVVEADHLVAALEQPQGDVGCR